VAGTLTPTGATSELVNLWEQGDVEIVVCPRLLDEVGRTLLDPRVGAKYHLDRGDVEEFVTRLRDEGIGLDDPVDPPRAVPSDPNDDYLVALALDAGADILVTRDAHFDEVRSKELTIMTPGRFVRRITELSDDEPRDQMSRSEAIGVLHAEPARTGVFCDFDGTLSAIVDRPEDARPVEGAAEVLTRLAHRFAIVAVISDRSLHDLRSRFAPEGVLLAGSYGRERSDREAMPSSRDWERIVAAAHEAVAGWDGVIVEPKGAALTLHYRLAPDRGEDIARVASALASEFSLQVRPGRMVAELTEPGPGKAEALRDLVAERGLQTFLFAGDDSSDGEAFAWARSSGRRCVLVGVQSAESPDAIERDADIVVDGPREFVRLLERLADAVVA
jgi:trehalose 6-phosphate phosphatase